MARQETTMAKIARNFMVGVGVIGDCMRDDTGLLQCDAASSPSPTYIYVLSVQRTAEYPCSTPGILGVLDNNEVTIVLAAIIDHNDHC